MERQQAESVNRKEDANVKFPFLADIIPGGSIQQLLMWINLLKFLNCAVNPCSKSNILSFFPHVFQIKTSHGFRAQNFLGNLNPKVLPKMDNYSSGQNMNQILQFH